MLVILIEKPEELDEFTEADMRRWWRHQCKKHFQDGEVLFEVCVPKRFNLSEGVKRLRSFGVSARIVRRRVQ